MTKAMGIKPMAFVCYDRKTDYSDESVESVAGSVAGSEVEGSVVGFSVVGFSVVGASVVGFSVVGASVVGASVVGVSDCSFLKITVIV